MLVELKSLDLWAAVGRFMQAQGCVKIAKNRQREKFSHIAVEYI